MQIGVVTRNDTDRIGGGDAIMLQNIRKQIAPIGVEMRRFSIADLKWFQGDALHLTQLYQLDIAEVALEFATKRGIPLFISPLLEEHLAIWFRQAIKQQAKWRIAVSVCGVRGVEWLYHRWQTARRTRSVVWQRQRNVLQRSRLVPNSQYELQHLRDWFTLPDLDATIVPLGVDPELYCPTNPSVGELPVELIGLEGRYVLQVGVISLRKNQDGLLRAMMDNGIPIVFLGPPSPYEPEFCREVSMLARERGNVTFLNQVRETTLPTLYRNAALHILPSWSERPGLVTLEAAACNCKTISTDRSPISEYLGDRVSYCDPGSVASIKDAVQGTMIKPLPGNLSQYVLSRFTWDRTAAELAAVYGASATLV